MKLHREIISVSTFVAYWFKVHTKRPKKNMWHYAPARDSSSET